MKRQIPIPTHYANGQRTHWPEMITKIANRLSPYPIGAVYKLPQSHYDFNGLIQGEYQPKIHHIVPADFECNPGDAIEFLAVTPDGDEFKFAPLVKCTGVQKIVIHHDPFERTVHLLKHNKRTRALREVEAAALIESEGYGSNQTFWKVHKAFQYTSWKLIHWTDKRY